MKMLIRFSFCVLVFLSSVAFANETYRFDQSHSTIGFSVHQFLGTTHGKFTKFDGKIDIDRDHPENSSVTADRKSTRLNSSHSQISYAVFCLKKKKNIYNNILLD